MKKFLPFFYCLFFTFNGIFAAGFTVPSAPVGHILDEVGILSTVNKEALENTLTSLEQETHHQIAIVIVKSLQGRTIEEVGITIGRTW